LQLVHGKQKQKRLNFCGEKRKQSDQKHLYTIASKKLQKYLRYLLLLLILLFYHLKNPTKSSATRLQLFRE